MFGKGTSGQLGTGSFSNNEEHPIFIDLLKEPIASIACAGDYTLFLDTHGAVM